MSLCECIEYSLLRSMLDMQYGKEINLYYVVIENLRFFCYCSITQPILTSKSLQGYLLPLYDVRPQGEGKKQCIRSLESALMWFSELSSWLIKSFQSLSHLLLTVCSLCSSSRTGQNHSIYSRYLWQHSLCLDLVLPLKQFRITRGFQAFSLSTGFQPTKQK